jgi:ABC-type Fe3+/spermidine/putrescine transport system ATPase subunit
MTLIGLHGLTKSYHPRSRPAVSDLSLDVGPGEIVAFLGPSGCGKTTTLKMIAGLLSPTSGDILFDGESVLRVPAERRNAVMVFQEHTLFPFMSVGENIGFGLQVRGIDKRSIGRKVDGLLEMVQLPGIATKRPQELSGGQRQRVALARALITEPRLLLLDEPLANLDAHLRDEMRNLILSVQKQTGVTTIVVTHDQEEAVLLADRIALLFDGELRHYAPPIDLFQRPRSERAARFFGGRNFIPAHRRGLTVQTPFGKFDLNHSAANAIPEGECTLTIRPEHIRIGAAEGPNTLEGILSSCIFIGIHTRCMIKAGDLELEVFKGVDSTMVREGGNLRLHFPREHLWLFPRT